jgi:hypothetical protein
MNRRSIALTIVLITTTASLSAWGQVDVKVVNTTATPVPVAVQPSTLQHDGTFFAVGPGATQTLVVPPGVVLTDAHVTFSVPEAIPNAASLFIRDGSGKILIYRIVNNGTFEAGIDLTSGIPSTGAGITVELSCYNISGNHCQGALMWSGHKP